MGMFDHPAVVAKAVFFIDGDQSGAEYQSAVIRHEGSLWLVATWLWPLGADTPIPEWLVPLETLDPEWVMPEGPHRLKQSISRELLSPDTAPKLAASRGMVLFQSVSHTPGPASSH